MYHVSTFPQIPPPPPPPPPPPHHPKKKKKKKKKKHETVHKDSTWPIYISGDDQKQLAIAEIQSRKGKHFFSVFFCREVRGLLGDDKSCAEQVREMTPVFQTSPQGER